MEHRGRSSKRQHEPSPGRFGNNNEYKIRSNQPHPSTKPARVLNRIRGHGCTIAQDSDATPCRNVGNDLYARREYDPSDKDIERIHRVCYQCHMSCQKQLDARGGNYVPRDVICPSERGESQMLKVAFAATNGCMNIHPDGEHSRVEAFDLAGTATRLREIEEKDMPMAVSTNGANRSHHDFPNWGAHQTTDKQTWPGLNPWPESSTRPWPNGKGWNDTTKWSATSRGEK